MPGLAETTAMLANLRRQTEALARGDDAGLTGRMATVEDFGPNPGALRLLSYLPEDLPANAPLVVVLHGCTQRAETHAAAAGWLMLADRYGFAVIAPEQSASNNPNRCFNWYETGDASRGRGEAASIRAMVEHTVAAHGLDARRVFVTGLSAGGAMTSVLLAAYPEVFAGGGIVAGLPYGIADNVQEALGAMYGGRARQASELGDLVRAAAPAGAAMPRVAIWHGDADATVRPHNAAEIAKQWASAHGLAEKPESTEALPGRTRSVWRASPDGDVLIESNLVDGLGHGTPLSTLGDDAIGMVAPYMLEAGVSAALEIARFWGLAPAETEAERQARPEPRAASAERPRLAPVAAVGDQVMASVSRHVPAEVQDVIAKALKTAGLMK